MAGLWKSIGRVRRAERTGATRERGGGRHKEEERKVTRS